MSRHTGAAQITLTFDELLDLAAPHSMAREWEYLDTALGDYTAVARPEEFSDYLPKEAAGHEDPDLVLTRSDMAPTHLRLAAFGLGLRTLKPHNVAVDFPHRLAPFRLVAVDGTVQGSAPLQGPP